MKQLKVFYCPQQSVPANVSLLSPSATKPEIVVRRWLQHKKNIEIQQFLPVSRDDFKLAHDASHVDEILACSHVNGFGTKDVEVAAALPWTTGSFCAAALYAYQHKTITCSPTSGFHHAEYQAAMGFCTFNGLMVAAIKLAQQFPGIKIGILDCDHHYGNGIDNIIREKNIDYISHYSFGGQEVDHYNWNGGPRGNDWLTRLPHILFDFFAESEIVLYQAGADPHKDDPFGGALSTEQLARRDNIIFDFFGNVGTPIVWNLAGGYQKPLENVLIIHDATVDAAIRVLPNY